MSYAPAFRCAHENRCAATFLVVRLAIQRGFESVGERGISEPMPYAHINVVIAIDVKVDPL